MTDAVELVGITKRFGGVLANDAVDLAIAKGSVHGIVGENGAGKSTLMRVLYGTYLPDEGEIRINGKRARIRHSQDAIAHGIGMVHQHFMLVETFSVIENVMLGVEGGRLLGGRGRVRSALARLARDFALEVDPDAIVGELPVGLQQRVEILKALYRGAEVLILDEPTGVLTPHEADHLFRIVRALAEDGKSVILITHKLREIMAATDRVTVMRAGRVVATLATAGVTRDILADLMVGRTLAGAPEKRRAAAGPVVLGVEGLRVADPGGIERVRGVSFAVRAGEIVGIAGVAGNGQSELLAALSGTVPATAGTIRLAGADVTRLGTRARRRAGLGHVPEDRLRMGLIADFTAAESAILGDHAEKQYNDRLLLNRRRVLAVTASRMTEYDVRPRDPLLRTALFSGGNQQKLVLAREISRRPALLLVGQPTRGVDVGAIEAIHRRLVALRDAGAAILLVSVELDEIRTLADRILVMFEGTIVGETTQAASDRALGLMMAGAKDAA
jgi:simple sugar transport system ATP-binding protein